MLSPLLRTEAGQRGPRTGGRNGDDVRWFSVFSLLLSTRLVVDLVEVVEVEVVVVVAGLPRSCCTDWQCSVVVVLSSSGVRPLRDLLLSLT